MQKITPCLWFDGQAEEAMNFYLSIFQQARVDNLMRFGEAGPGPTGSLLAATFELEGQTFIALNGATGINFTPAISLLVSCETQTEIDGYWDKLLAGGEAMQCGWLKDKFGICWQIVPRVLGQMMRDPDPAKAGRVMQTMMQMVKLDIATLTQAHERA